jgi:Na+/melibiose symporter-like transporter
VRTFVLAMLMFLFSFLAMDLLSTILALRLIFAITPVVLLALALWVAFRYRLSGEVHQRLNKLLALRRAGEPQSRQMNTEAAELERLLILPPVCE